MAIGRWELTLFIIHGTWLPSSALALWVEHTAPDGALYPLPACWQAPEGARLDELAAQAPALAQALGAKRRGVELPWPSAQQAPRSSLQLASGLGADALVPREVPAALLYPSRALPVLRELAGEAGPLTRDVALAPDAAFWGQLAGELDVLAGEGRIAPALRHAGGTWFGQWTLLPDGPVHRWLGELALAAPPSAIALAPGGTARAAILAAADELTDLIVREAIGGTSIGLAPGTRRSPMLDWLTSLEAGQPVEGWPEADMRTLERAVERWRASAFKPPFELLLRIAEPDGVEQAGPDQPADAGDDGQGPAGDATGGAGQWSLQLRLRSAADPSLVVTAAQAATLPDAPARPAELILTELGRAAQAYPPLLAITGEQLSFDVPLSIGDLLPLVETGIPALQLAGFAVQLPSRWARPRPGLKLTAAPREAGEAAASAGAGFLGMNQLMDFTWQLALGEGEAPLSEDEMRLLAEAKEPLVRLRGRWVQLDGEALGKALRFLREAPRSEGTLGEMFAQLASGTELPVPITEVDASGWVGQLLSAGHDQLEQVAVPAGLNAQLRPYQLRGVSWLDFMTRLGLGAILADDMGLGKTIQLLAQLLTERERDPSARPTLVVCPMSVVGNWQREAARFTPSLRTLVHHGSDRAIGGTLLEQAGRSDLVITSYGLLARDAGTLAQVAWGRVALDEAQHIKNYETRTARAARLVGASASHRVALSGTPVENRLDELRSILDFANPGLLGSAQGFRKRFGDPIEKERDQAAASQLRQLTGPFVLRRLKTDPAIITELPDKLELTVRANLTAEQASLYQAVVDSLMARLEAADGMQRRGMILAALTQLKQVCNHPAHFLSDGSGLLTGAGEHRSGKLALIDDILDTTLADGEKALCFTQYRAFGAMLQPYFSERFGRPIAFLHGSLSKKAREQVVDEFQSDDGPPILLLSLKAGGTGLNLTAASQVVHIDRWWNPAVEDQATDRAYRIGQRRRVQVRKMICVGTLEERIDQMISSKRELAALAVGTGEGWLTELSTEQLAELVTLSSDAVAR